MKSLYVHIPFCKQKCYYCDFNSYSGKENLIDEYMKALKKELLFVLKQNNDEPIFKTIYFGGGTPSFILAEHIKDFLTSIKCEGEITLELNPGTITREKLMTYKEAGINRLSIGLQTTNDELLKRIGRIHSLKEFEEAYKTAREEGFNNISVDLMFGLPGQTIEDVAKDIDYLIRLNPEHISCYSLIVHEELVDKHPDAFKDLPEDETEREMYYLICNRLKEVGYEQYEISNFAKPWFESKHNMCYWNQDEYYGIGAGASSYINDVRLKNIDDIKEYIVTVDNQNVVTTIGRHQMVEETQTKETKLKEYMILKLRLIKGVLVEEANKRFGTNILEVFAKEIEKLKNLELIEQDNECIRLTSKGLDLANIVWEEFI